jgi:hypothetical protein
MNFLESVKHIAEKAIGWKRPERPKSLPAPTQTDDLQIQGRRPYPQPSEMAIRSLQERGSTTRIA